MAEGVKFGRKRKLSDYQRAEAVKRRAAGETLAAIAKSYGVDVTSGPLTGLTARAVVVLDENDQVVHAELVGEIKNEPNYDAALAALK